MHRRLTIFAACVALPVIAAAAPAAAQQQQPSAQPPAAAQTKPYVLEGFRSAQFGMSKDEVRAAIAKDFPEVARAVKEVANDVDATTALAIKPANLKPAPGEPTITYIFGKDSKRLIHVNVVWFLDVKQAGTQREELVRAGLKLVDYFQTLNWAGNRALAGVPVGRNSVVMFLAKDEKGSALEVRADGIAYEERQSVAQTPLAARVPTGPARLRVAYSRNPDQPDVNVVKPGQF
jgi:hypothetical protein